MSHSCAFFQERRCPAGGDFKINSPQARCCLGLEIRFGSFLLMITCFGYDEALPPSPTSREGETFSSDRCDGWYYKTRPDVRWKFKNANRYIVPSRAYAYTPSGRGVYSGSTPHKITTSPVGRLATTLIEDPEDNTWNSRPSPRLTGT